MDKHGFSLEAYWTEEGEALPIIRNKLFGDPYKFKKLDWLLKPIAKIMDKRILKNNKGYKLCAIFRKKVR